MNSGTLDDGQTPITKEDIWNDPDKYSNFYDKAKKYWEGTPATVQGVMGGFEDYSDLDIKGSRDFMLQCLSKLGLPKQKQRNTKSLDCGAGVGRVSNLLLKKFYSEVHLIEVAEPLIEEAKNVLKDYPSKFFCTSLHTVEPDDKYDVIWAQWVLGHLTDEDLVEFFKKMSNNLKETGFIVIKENCCSNGFILDQEDSSITRSKQDFERIFELSNLESIFTSRQQRWPKNLYPVFMWGLKPKKN